MSKRQASLCEPISRLGRIRTEGIKGGGLPKLRNSLPIAPLGQQRKARGIESRREERRFSSRLLKEGYVFERGRASVSRVSRGQLFLRRLSKDPQSALGLLRLA